MRIMLIIALELSCAAGTAFGQNNGPPGRLPAATVGAAAVIFPKEELTYEVSWMGINLGQVRSVITSISGEGERKTVSAIGYIDSYSSIPFVDLHATFETTMDAAGIPSFFRAVQKKEERWEISQYQFDQQKQKLIVKESIAETAAGKGSVVQKIDTLSVDKNCLDGLSLLFVARLNVRSKKEHMLPTVINGEQGSTLINFYAKETSEEIDAVEYPVDVIEFDGVAKFTGIFGLSGPFKGWFSNDEAHVPIRAQMKVILGSVNIELIQWKRAGWKPPRRVEE